jgi:putative endonuclease
MTARLDAVRSPSYDYLFHCETVGYGQPLEGGLTATPRQNLGKWGESLAADYLVQRGYILVERNARTPYGELDLVMRQGEGLVFVEVKTRASRAYGLPEESITPRKQEHLLNAARAYLQNHTEISGDWRVDVIAIRRIQGSPAEVVHFENVLH